MREIKYKAWDKKDKVVRDVVGMSFYHESVSVDIEYGKYLQDDIKRFELMQYTGLKDKNDVEIYEGDVIKTRLNRIYRIVHTDGVDIGCNAGEYEYWVSGFVPAAIDGVIDNSGESEFGYDQFVTGECEVIGNIYEHPHLLEE